MPHAPDTPPDPLDALLGKALGSTLRSEEEARREIARRAQEIERQAEEKLARLAASPDRLRIAAGVLPPGVLTGGLALAAGKKLSFKGLPGLVAIPAVSFAMVLVTLAGGFRALRKLREPTEAKGGGQDPGTVTTAWWKRNRGGAGISMVAAALLALLGHPETALFCLLLSTCGAAMLLAELARAGVADRETVGRWTAGLLWNLGLYGFFFRDLLPPSAGASGVMAVIAVLFLGAPLCLIASGQLTWSRLVEAFDSPVQRLSDPDLPSVVCLRFLMSLLALTFAAGLLLLLGALGLAFVPSRPDAARLAEYVEQLDADEKDVSAWHELDRILTFFEESGEPLRANGPRRALSSALASESSLVRDARHAAARFQLVGDDVLSEWAEGSLGAQLASERKTVIYPSVHGVTIHAALATGTLGEEERARVADALEADWPAPKSQRAVAELRDRVELLEALGHGERLAAHYTAMRETLTLAWPATHHWWYPTAAFFWDEESASQGLSVRRGRNFYAGMWQPTEDALFLMERCGVPEELDLEPLHEAIARALAKSRKEALLSRVSIEDPGLELIALRLARLRGEDSSSSAGPIAMLIEHRLLIAALGLVAICILASRQRQGGPA